jgi:hypothetical protein
MCTKISKLQLLFTISNTIIIPNHNAYNVKQEIVDSIRYIGSDGYVFIICAGPTATVIYPINCHAKTILYMIWGIFLICCKIISVFV